MSKTIKDFQFIPQPAEGGGYVIAVTYNGTVVATGKNVHPTIEPAMGEMLAALDKLDLASVIEPNGALLDVEVYP